MEGKGRFTNKEGIIYEGIWVHGERNGFGKETKRILIFYL